MGKFYWYIIVPTIVIGALFIGIYSIFKPLDRIIKKERLRLFIKVLSRTFCILLLIGYLLSIAEGFENFELGEFTLGNYFKNFFRTLEYFIGWVLVYWFLIYAIISLIIASVWLVFTRRNY